MAKGEPLWLAELGREPLPWRLDGFRLKPAGNEEPAMEALSPSDLECFEAGFARALDLLFGERTAATQGHDWQAACLGTMHYEDMIDEVPEKPDIVAYLPENARFLRL